MEKFSPDRRRPRKKSLREVGVPGLMGKPRRLTEEITAELGTPVAFALASTKWYGQEWAAAERGWATVGGYGLVGIGISIAVASACIGYPGGMREGVLIAGAGNLIVALDKAEERIRKLKEENERLRENDK